MKTKLKGQSGVKGLLLLHGEKMLIGLFAIAAAYFVYSALGVDSLPDEFQAKNLEDKIVQTNSTITGPSNSWDKVKIEHPDKIHLDDKSVKTDSVAVTPDVYGGIKEGISRPVLARIDPRTDPKILAAERVVATSGADLFSFSDPTVRSQYELNQKLNDEKKAQEQKRQQDLQGNDARGSRGARRGRRDEEEKPLDAAHPNRRPVARTPRAGSELQGGELIELNRWVSVVAKVPVRSQMSLYRTAFENASGGFNPETDSPVYLGYRVERAEIVPGQAALNWQAVPVFDAKGSSTRRQIANAMTGNALQLLADAQTNWVGAAGEVVDPRHLYPEDCLVYPLPPLVGREWGKEATHPDIPLASEVTDSDATASPDIAQQQAGPVAGQSADDFAAGPSANTGRDQRDNGRREPGGRREAARSTGREADGRTAGIGRAAAGALGGPPAGVDHYLLRFFDFTTEPGKRYTYRVQLVIGDPNAPFFSKPTALDAAVLDRLRKAPKTSDGRPNSFLAAPWSEPSPPVGIPLDGRVRLASATPGENGTVKLVVDGFTKSPESGAWVQASTLKDFSRGGIVNFEEDSEYLTEERTHVDKMDNVKFVTGITVLDMRGGEKLGRDLSFPSRVLLLGPSGELSIRREMEDAPAVQTHIDIFTKPKPSAARAEPERGGGGGRGGGR